MEREGKAGFGVVLFYSRISDTSKRSLVNAP